MISSFIFLFLTVGVFVIARLIYARLPYPFLTPVLTASSALVLVLFLFNIPYETYIHDVKILTEMLGAATVALAFPLYKQRELIKKYVLPIMVGVVAGTVLGITSGLLLSKSLHLDDLLTYSLLPKSVTTPVAMEIAKEVGGIPSLAAVLVIIAGLSGIILGPYFFKWCRLTSDLALGIGLGSAAHAIGTSKAFEYGDEVAAYSSVAMTLSALFASFLAPLLVVLMN